MRYEYPCSLVNGHLIVHSGANKLLIDICSPSSCGDSPTILFAGRFFPMPTKSLLPGLTFSSDRAGTRLNTILGADILNRYDIAVDLASRRLILNTAGSPLTGTLLELDFCSGGPIVDAMVGDEKVRMFVDTCAKLSVLEPEITSKYPVVAVEPCSSPFREIPSTNTYDIEFSLGAEKVTLRVGDPRCYRRALSISSESQGILGTAIFRTHRITLAPRQGTMAIQRIHE